MEAGADDYDTKPIEIDKLLAKMEALLNKVAGEDFNRAMLPIRLGHKPPTEDLKNGMLGR